ncbi:unnamed protein product [Phytophthora lilii]|uniref:Unnamed protein product n=1 Tax=Phytophthora lilii TaxID=2077276 RepID=A0A9W6XG84_9STRA|nr:unnamed protein product [Phytophthora lilii]
MTTVMPTRWVIQCAIPSSTTTARRSWRKVRRHSTTTSPPAWRKRWADPSHRWRCASGASPSPLTSWSRTRLTSRSSSPRSSMSSRQNEVQQARHQEAILRNVSGIFKPGTITLVLGQPGSGKSSLMKLISGRFPQDNNITMDGEVTNNGTPANDLRKRHPQFVSYVSQPTSTTLCSPSRRQLSSRTPAAAAVCRRETSSTSRTAPPRGEQGRARRRQSHVQTLLGHRHPAARTRQLPEHHRRRRHDARRVRRRAQARATGEMEFGNKYVMMMDEISTGLDSAATFDIITTQRSIAKKFRKTVVISLLQPSPEVFELFDDVVILNEGHVMYHGPRAEALDYFESLGFKCPPLRDVLDLGTDKQAQAKVSSIASSSIPRSATQYADVFTRSSIYERMMEELHGPVHPALVNDNVKHVDPIPNFLLG